MSQAIVTPPDSQESDPAQELVDHSISLLEQAQTAIKAAEDRAATWERVAGEKAIELEKIASAPKTPLLNKNDVSNFFDALVDNDLLDLESSETLKQASLADPNILLKTASRLIQFSAPAHSEGAGIERNSADTTIKPTSLFVEEGWDKVAALADKKVTS